jgi:CRP-like cAMP-binding protein
MTSTPDFLAFYEGLDALKKKEIDSYCEAVTAAPQDIIYEQDTPSDALYIIEKGVVEALAKSPDQNQTRSIAYLCRGDVFGELGCLTGHNRVATIRACEDVVLRKIRQQDFVHLIKRNPSFALFVATRLAERMYRTTASQLFNSCCIDLSGNLLNFDLLIIFQTIQSSARTGELRLINPNNDVFGTFFFEGGSSRYGRFAHLQGLEAVWQLFLDHTLQGTFTFQIMESPPEQNDPAHRITLDGTDLLMQAATKRDYFIALPPPLKELKGSLQAQAAALQWIEKENAEGARQVWHLIEKRAQPLSSLWKRVNLSHLTFAQIVAALTASGQAAVIDS